MELADSWATDGHKWLQVPYDCGYAFVRDPEAHRRAMIIAASYLPLASTEYDASQFAPELSRRARGFATWAVLRHLGREGVAAMVRAHCGFTERLAKRLAAEPGVRVLNEVVLNQVIVSSGDGDGEARDAATRAVIARLQQDNQCFAGGASWRGRWVLRISVISAPLTQADIDRLGDALIAAWRAVQVETVKEAQA
jgi:glutamate/tyrosine decarboxylase-like PLP-dependent enzyme